MPTDPRKRQKKQERQAAKRKAKRGALARQTHAGLAERLAVATRYPILHCWATEDLWSQGIGWVCLSRELPNGTVAFAVFLVDRYCLGVKNALANITGRFTYDTQVARKAAGQSTLRRLPPATARKFVQGAVAYAGALGLRPHPDYETARRIFGDIDAGQSTEELEFGKDGKPLFIAGPHDGPERCRRILRTLEQACGPGGFDYLIPLTGDANVLPESLKQAQPRLIGPDADGTIRDGEMDSSSGSPQLPGPLPEE